MTSPPSSGLVPVHLLGLPVPLAAAGRQHFEELTREFLLLASSEQHGDGSPAGHVGADVPTRLLELVAAVRAQFGGVGSDADQRLEEAIDTGRAVIDDHVLEVPVEAGPAAVEISDMIDLADAYCRQGQHLLTLATPPLLVAYRHWYLGEIQRQVQGHPPTSWSEYAAQR